MEDKPPWQYRHQDTRGRKCTEMQERPNQRYGLLGTGCRRACVFAIFNHNPTPYAHLLVSAARNIHNSPLAKLLAAFSRLIHSRAFNTFCRVLSGPIRNLLLALMYLMASRILLYWVNWRREYTLKLVWVPLVNGQAVE